MRTVGAVVRGIRTPIVREGDDLVTPEPSPELLQAVPTGVVEISSPATPLR